MKGCELLIELVTIVMDLGFLRFFTLFSFSVVVWLYGLRTQGIKTQEVLQQRA
jgi:hypothetical protein